MPNTNDIPWKRTAAEGVAIVVSILLAFGSTDVGRYKRYPQVAEID